MSATIAMNRGWLAARRGCAGTSASVIAVLRVFVPVILLFGNVTRAADLDDVRQLVVAIAPSWDAMSGSAQRFERGAGGWQSVGRPWPVLFGRSGLAWGRGVRGQDEKGLHKVERDGRAPAGLFRIGSIYTYDRALPRGSDYPFHTVTAADAWVDDVNHPKYNQHVIVDPDNPPPWYAKQRMRLGDFAYRWLVEIRHNSDPPVPGRGSAIFLHIRRGPQKPSAGCTTMAEGNLITLIQWLRAGSRPHFVLLPRSEYIAKWKAWNLPPPSGVAGELLTTK
jgi:L,D-peptidoglycan transpeptidase YkuD (ErfK/YbiS/YcfS/YnhG family)